MLNKTFLNFLFGFVCIIAVAFVVLLFAAAHGGGEAPSPDVNVAHQ